MADKQGGNVPYEARARQLGMKELVVWEKFVRDFGGYYDRTGMNVPVWWILPGVEDGKVDMDVVKKSHPDFRIDAVGGRGSTVDIIEVKEIADVKAIGQVLTYEVLFMMTYEGVEHTQGKIVCGRCPDAIAGVCGLFGIDVVEVWKKET